MQHPIFYIINSSIYLLNVKIEQRDSPLVRNFNIWEVVGDVEKALDMGGIQRFSSA